MKKPYHTTIVLVGSKKGSQGYHVFRDDRLVFRMSLTFGQQTDIVNSNLCGIDPMNPPESITIINPFSVENLSEVVETIDDAKIALDNAFRNQRDMFSSDY